MRILHISADYPDPLAAGKTRAVSGLLSLTPEHDHRVCSLNRVSWRHGVAALPFEGASLAIAYGAPPRGLLLRTRLRRVADVILDHVARMGDAVDVVHAHKLSVDGLVGAQVADALKVPLIVSSQGDSDLKIIGARRDLRPLWRRIWRDAAVALPFAPWTAARLEALLGPRSGPVTPLPCPTAQDAPITPRRRGPLLRTAFHLAAHQRKNAAGLLAAVALAARSEPALRLEIHGGGDPEGFSAVHAAIARAGAPAHLAGPAPHDRMGALLNDAGGFALPSRRESFGMVFIEALFAGTPVLHPRGFAIDGYLPDGAVSVAVDAADPAAIADGLLRLLRDEDLMKTRLHALQTTGGLDLFRRDAIAAAYRAALAQAAPAAQPAVRAAS